MSQIIIGYTYEGPTDLRFLSGIIQRTFVDVGFECNKDIEVVEPVISIKKEPGNRFNEAMIQCCQQAFDNGVMAFCIHVDADDASDENVFRTRINPAMDEIKEISAGICNNLVALVPIQMIESWMLADKELLKAEIGTDMSDADLGLTRKPESISEPKETIKQAIRIARQNLVKKLRKELDISELYQPLGQKIPMNSLNQLPSYRKFKEEVRKAYKRLNYL